ncbi:MAG: PAS domain-containing protein, partial [Actinobacteria bacterium]|nr:PAS domain-containing protein [Actinomycetota bacterium]
ADDSLETIYVGPQIADILGVSQEEYLTDPHLWERHIHAEDRQRALDAVYDFIRTDREADYLEYRWVRPDGRVVWINDRTVKVRDADGRALMLQGVMFDVTQRKEAEEARRETEARFRTLVEHIPAAFHISGLDETASTIYISPQVEAILGYAPEEWVADDELWLKLLHPDDRERAVAVNRHHVTTHGPMSEDYRMIARDGRVVWIHDESVVMRDEQGRPLNAQGILLDITERKEDEELLRAGEEELRRSLEVLRRTDEERRQLLTRLLAAQEEERERVAEDIQDDSIQHMAAVGIRLETLRRQLTDPSQLGAVDQLGRTVEEAVGRLRHLLLELRPRILEKDGLAPALREYLESMAAEAGFSFAVDDRLAEEPPLEVRTAAYRIAQDAIQNVRDHARAGLVEVALSERDGGLLCRVTDDGVGFDPLAGSEAMGLAAMRERTELAGGWVRVRTAPGAGTTVEFWLPCEGPPGGGETAPAS